MVQDIIVAAIVIVAFGVSAWKLMPALRRIVLWMFIDRWAARHPRLAAWRQRSLQPRIARAAGAGCAGCAANGASRPHSPPR